MNGGQRIELGVSNFGFIKHVSKTNDCSPQSSCAMSISFFANLSYFDIIIRVL